ncbi:MAG: hypothetical protein ACT4P7_23385 [Gemmatimonadaceae bacterium]
MSLWRWFTGTHRLEFDPDQLAQGDPWVRLPFAPPLPAFGPGSHHEFVHYLEGVSRVVASSPGEIAEWLLQCRYADDPQLLDEPDHWQHPCTFELVRSGDCEDYALWAWRKLVDASYDAEFVVGTHERPDGISGRHAWVIFREGSQEYVLDGVQRTMATIVRLRARAAAEYVPQVGVSGNGRRFIFAGLFRSEWGRRLEIVRHHER